ncbi:MAG: hypothetical protein MK078_03275 [Crocinitomicaceae bacterium]|nr:hypothetical protein [Crocinitomicaceae bacterium]
MKKLIFILLLGFLTSAHAYGEWIPNWTIFKDSINLDVPQGKCLVKGYIVDYGGNRISQGIVGTTDFKKQAKVDEEGNFELLLDDTDSSIFFFAHGYSESVLYNYDFKSQHEVSMEFLAYTDMGVIEVEKPVIYCYSDKPISFDLNLELRSELVFSYPNYNEDGWKIDLDQEGIQVNNSTYPYLFWEGETEQLTYSTSNEGKVEGFIIKTDTCITFMENTLSSMGLNTIEKTDFITYWGPRLLTKDYALIQFVLDDEYSNEIAGITTSVQPDNQRRVFMKFTSMDVPYTSFDLTTPSFTQVQRDGFTLIEWGGAEIPLEVKMLTN